MQLRGPERPPSLAAPVVRKDDQIGSNTLSGSQSASIRARQMQHIGDLDISIHFTRICIRARAAEPTLPTSSVLVLMPSKVCDCLLNPNQPKP